MKMDNSLRIIVNADDFGVDLDRDEGIVAGAIEGAITSISIICTSKLNPWSISQLHVLNNRVSCGLHLNLTDQQLVSCELDELFSFDFPYNDDEPILISNSKINVYEALLMDRFSQKRLAIEIEAQMQSFVEQLDRYPDFIDAHNHVFVFSNELYQIVQDIANRYHIPVRIPYEPVPHCALLRPDFKDKVLRAQSLIDRHDRNLFTLASKGLINEIYESYDGLLYNFAIEKLDLQHSFPPFSGTCYGHFRSHDILCEILNEQFSYHDTLVLMAHPGFYDKDIIHQTRFSNYQRLVEYNNLIRLKDYCLASGISLVKWNDLY